MNSSYNKEQQIKTKLLRWYKENKRFLAWRVLNEKNLPNSYHVLVSEFMLQQTTVNTVKSKFDEFIKKWPNLKSLSQIQEKSILKFWSGLGYYSRARNLLKTAKKISKLNNYIVPSKYNNLIILPGIGDYTAKAILGIAYNKPVLPVDANIKRIIVRVYALLKSTNLISKEIFLYSRKLISKNNSSNLIQAFMDYGSKICLPTKPKCGECIISSNCLAFKKNLANVIPLKIIKKARRKKYTKAYVVTNEVNEVLVRRRSAKGMLPSMIEVPTSDWLENKIKNKKDVFEIFISRKFYKINNKLIYPFSHFDLYVEIFYIKIKKRKIKNYSWISIKKIDSSGMPTLMKKIVKNYQLSVER